MIGRAKDGAGRDWMEPGPRDLRFAIGRRRPLRPPRLGIEAFPAPRSTLFVPGTLFGRGFERRTNPGQRSPGAQRAATVDGIVMPFTRQIQRHTSGLQHREDQPANGNPGGKRSAGAARSEPIVSNDARGHATMVAPAGNASTLLGWRTPLSILLMDYRQIPRQKLSKLSSLKARFSVRVCQGPSRVRQHAGWVPVPFVGTEGVTR